jgi:cold shock CspA family protein
MLADIFIHITTIRSLKRLNSQEHIHFMQNAATRIEGKIDQVQKTMNDGFQVCSFAM